MGGSGILPTCIHKNKLYFLFGKENRFDKTPGWCDFGGGKEKGESFMKNALREGTEELIMFISIQVNIEFIFFRLIMMKNCPFITITINDFYRKNWRII